jgi:voltage-gated potassium channel
MAGNSQWIVEHLDRVVKWVAWWSVVALLIEVATGSEDSLKGHPFWLWNERAVGVLFTVEFLARLWRAGRDLREYLLSPFGIIDLLSILPFWVGFVLPTSWLHTIRTLRVLRLLKLFRYSRSLQFAALGFFKSSLRLRSITVIGLIIAIFASVAIHEFERVEQEEFESLLNCFWFILVTASTVGYGDLSPVTTMGKVTVMFFMVGGLGLFAAGIGVIASSFAEVNRLYENPDIDPMQEFRKEWKKQEILLQAEGEFSVEEAGSQEDQTD